jgi:hypothetical protein
MPPRERLPHPLDARPFSVREAHAAGVTPDRLRSGDLAAPFWGIRQSLPIASTVLAMARAYAPRMRPDHVFSHVTAAALWGMPLPYARTAALPLDVTAIAPARAPAVRGVIGRSHAIRPDEVRELDGLRVPSVELTWMMLGGILPVADLVAAGDFALTASGALTALTTVDSLAACMSARQGARGAPKLRTAMSLLRPGPLSRPESLLRVAFSMGGLPEPAINRPVLTVAGAFVATPDLSWPEFRVAVEYEGDYHRTERDQFHRDIGRIERMHDIAWQTVRVSAPALFDDTPSLVAMVARRLVSAGWTGRARPNLRNLGRLDR